MKITGLPRIKFKLNALLAVLLATAVFLELFVLYQYGYLNLSKSQEQVVQSRQILDIKSYMSMRSWVERNDSYQPPDYVFSGPEQGRDNPLLEY